MSTAHSAIHTPRLRSALAPLLCFALAACSDGTEPATELHPDSGVVIVGNTDASGTDTGNTDAGSNTDAGNSTTGNTDAGSNADAGSTTGFELLAEYEPAAGQPGSTAIPTDDARFVAWANGYVTPFDYGSDVDEAWRDPERALGPAEGNSNAVTSLGNGGSLVLTFASPLRNGEGPDFAVFENAFDDFFLELAFVEVSSNGRDFVRFGSAYLGDDPVGQYDTHNTELIGGLAGKYRMGFGTPFDLELLSGTPQAEQGQLDLDRITHVRIVDIVGDGSQEDSFGHPIYDPTPTIITAGFDLDGIGVIHNNE